MTVDKEESFTPPQDVASAAAMGLKLREQFKRGGTHIGARRGTQLANREAVSVDTLRRMVSYFARHAVDAQAAGWEDRQDPSPGWIAWLLWGGDPGKRWAESIVRRIDKADGDAHNLFAALVLPPDIAKQFPSEIGDGYNLPHITVLHAEMDTARIKMVEQIVKDAAGLTRPFPVELAGSRGAISFPCPEGRALASPVVSNELHRFRQIALDMLMSCGINAEGDFTEYKPHATFKYVSSDEAITSADPVPSGLFVARKLNVWIDGNLSSFAVFGDEDGDGVEDEIQKRDIGRSNDNDLIDPPRVSISKPYANQHTARQRDPADYVTFRRYHPDGFPDGVDLILGIKRGGGSETQSVRFDDAKWSKDRALAWLKEHDFSVSQFEPSSASASA